MEVINAMNMHTSSVKMLDYQKSTTTGINTGVIKKSPKWAFFITR
jgi:hypothetical protein